MNKLVEDLIKCPVDVDDCRWLQELESVKQEIEALKLQVILDPLTGLYNLRHFKTRLEIEIQRTTRTSRPTSLIIVDLDHFKAVNDQRGHEVGNITLQTVAMIFKNELRQFDVISRYGGEEFAIILPHTPLPVAVKVAERVRESLASTPIVTEQGKFNITASLGVGEFAGGTPVSVEKFVEQVDQHLYRAKNSGRNQVAHDDFDFTQSETELSRDEKADLFASADQEADESGHHETESSDVSPDSAGDTEESREV